MDHQYATYLERLLEGDHRGCASIVEELLGSGTSVRDLYEDLFARALQEVGSLWETNQVSVAKEHLATALTERLMAQIAPGIFADEHLDRSAIVSCPADEIHQVGGRMVADILEMSGWHAHFLGANTPFDDLVALISEEDPDLLAFSLALPRHFPSLAAAIEKVRAASPDLPIVLGGQAFRDGGREIADLYSGVSVLDSLVELESFVRGL